MQLKCLSLGIGLASCVVLSNQIAHAETNIIKDPDRHPHYVFEAEPHFFLGPIGKPPLLPGAGFRGTVVLAQEGFIDRINDSVGLGFGVDFTKDNTWIPIVMQWNFWLSEHWSVFGEPGFAFKFADHGKDNRADFTIYGGGRYRLSDRVTLTMRIGYPAFTAGFSFLL
ncbi:MAG TPA: hypothetical protein VER12_19095 [Polyangiaceae bacterium]|nr:hypothetical protein [Polyangiaceae bacterium]